MFAYAIIKIMENALFPFLKDYNISTTLNNHRSQKSQLSFNDLTAELENIKLCELKLGQGVQVIQTPKLNEVQTAIFQVLKIDPKKMTEKANKIKK